MLTSILLWSACVIVYLFIGTVIGQISHHIWEKNTQYDDKIDSYRVERKLETLLFFPGSFIREYVHKNDLLLFLPLLVDLCQKKTYLETLAFAWPLKLAWNLSVITIYGLIMFFIAVTRLLSKPFDKVLEATKAKKSVAKLPPHTRDAKRPADKREGLKRDLFDTKIQIQTLQDIRDSLLKELQKLEQEQAADQGANVYRADNSTESKWRPSKNN